MLKHTPKKRLRLVGETLSVMTEKKLSDDKLRFVVGGVAGGSSSPISNME